MLTKSAHNRVENTRMHASSGAGLPHMPSSILPPTSWISSSASSNNVSSTAASSLSLAALKRGWASSVNHACAVCSQYRTHGHTILGQNCLPCQESVIVRLLGALNCPWRALASFIRTLTSQVHDSLGPWVLGKLI